MATPLVDHVPKVPNLFWFAAAMPLAHHRQNVPDLFPFWLSKNLGFFSFIWGWALWSQPTPFLTVATPPAHHLQKVPDLFQV